MRPLTPGIVSESAISVPEVKLREIFLYDRSQNGGAKIQNSFRRRQRFRDRGWGCHIVNECRTKLANLALELASLCDLGH